MYTTAREVPALHYLTYPSVIWMATQPTALCGQGVPMGQLTTNERRVTCSVCVAEIVGQAAADDRLLAKLSDGAA